MYGWTCDILSDADDCFMTIIINHWWLSAFILICNKSIRSFQSSILLGTANTQPRYNGSGTLCFL